MAQDNISANLAVVEAHFGSEAAGRIDAAIDLYTDDIVWEAPSRNLLLKGKEAVAANYREMFSGFKDVEFHTLDRFATGDRVADDSIITFEVTKDGFIPLPVGTKCEMRLTHIFEMRGGKISKEIAIEGTPKARWPRPGAFPKLRISCDKRAMQWPSPSMKCWNFSAPPVRS